MNFQADDERKGDLMRVTYVDEELGTVFLRLTDGRTAWITGIESGALEKNDTILSCDGEWFKVPSEVWPTSHITSVIREVLEDGTILGESGSALLTLSNPKALTISPNSTVEIDGSSAILRVLSKDPIRVRQHPADEETSAATFLGSGPIKLLA